MNFDANTIKTVSVVSIGAVAAALVLGMGFSAGEATTEEVTHKTQRPSINQMDYMTESVSFVAADSQSYLQARSRMYKRAVRSHACRNTLVVTLYNAGFRGENLREAWAIAMRESNGQNIGPGNPRFNGEDWGIVQFNKPTWGNEPWWDDEKILDPDYSAQIMYRLSNGGKNWQMWGLTGSGEINTSMYGGWSSSQQWAWIIEPYQRWYKQYPC